MLFLPAGTFGYWQAWVFLAVFTVTSLLFTLYLQAKDPAALRRRTHAGPLAETRPVQKAASTLVFVLAIGVIVFGALDHRFGWSPVRAGFSVLGDVLLAVGLGLAMLVVVQNSYAAANVTVEAGQRVVSTGLYGVVRHPMYTGTLIMTAGIPLALGSWWGLAFLVPTAVVLVIRILDEESMLMQELDGYRDYASRTRYRLVPGIW